MARTSGQIRSEFIKFFEQRGHTAVPSGSLLPGDDPTLLFANAGMNQFKDVFLGTGTRPYQRAVNSQKCIRAGGKHNDLEDVGHDTYHHTFFEMLGNWSFGDYFKAEAIAWAWELLTEKWGLEKERLHATVFGGEKSAGLDEDLEAAEVWAKVTGRAAGSIIRGGMKDNFWEMAQTGPCGPCSEIHYDFGEGSCDGGGHPGQPCGVNVSGCGRFIEIWNLVFIQYNRDETGKLTPLPAKHVDTGMGFERLCRVLQGKASNYDTDVFAPLMKWLEGHSGVQYGAGAETDVAFRVIADHARSCTFAIADGVLPGNEGRGYVIRRILRRAARFGRKLDQHEPFLFNLVDVLAKQMGEVFPELAQRAPKVAETIKEEEAGFNRTLDRGLEEFRAAVYWLVPFYIEEQRPDVQKEESPEGGLRITIPLENGKKEIVEIQPEGNVSPIFDKLGIRKPQIPGSTAFELYATYGFPVDLTQLMAAERGLSVDMKGYEKEMEEHRRISSAGGEAFQAAAITGLPETDDTAKYEKKSVQATIKGWVVGEKYLAEGALETGAEAAVVLDRTNFYGESGGQVGDSGRLTAGAGNVFTVQTARLLGHCVLHVGKVTSGRLTLGQQLTTEIDPARKDTTRNHTATHLLNWALRKVLGPQIDQAGSVVEPARLRFDFTHNQALTEEQLTEVERLVNERVLSDEPVHVVTMALAQAHKLPGVRAVFGEKYPDPVRVVVIGEKPSGDLTAEYSAEFCGGTHLDRSGQMGFFKIVSQEAIARGVRRVTAVTGHEAVRCVQKLDQVVRAASGLLRVPPEQVSERIAAMQAEIKQLRKGPQVGGESFQESFALETPRGKVVIGQAGTAGAAGLRGLCDTQRQKGASAVLIGGADGEKVALVAMVSEELVKAGVAHAGDWVKAAAAAIGGSGGGKPTLAQAGGKDPARLPEALGAAKDWIVAKLQA